MKNSRLEPTLEVPGEVTLRAEASELRQLKQPVRRRGFWFWAGGWFLALLILLLSPVIALRWLPPPTTAFMLQSETQPVRYVWVPSSKIAEVARRAVVAAEDQKFWMHNGFDIEAIEKAYEHNQKKSRRKIRGASTISQQTAKNLFLWSGGGYFRKGIEAGFTMLIEKCWGKDRVLEMYLNIAEFGPGIYGVEAASQIYFKKSAAQLTPEEAARLAAVLPSPRRWNVINPGPYVQSRVGWVLRQMGYGRRAEPEDEPEPEPEPLESAPLASDAYDAPAPIAEPENLEAPEAVEPASPQTEPEPPAMESWPIPEPS